MLTYGTPATARDYPKDPTIANYDREIARLVTQKAAKVVQCVHHFVPQEGILAKLKRTLLDNVYDAGTIGELNGRSDTLFPLCCTKCGTSNMVPMSMRCPACASPTQGVWGKHEQLSQHFGAQDFGYNNIWVISCTACDFKAAGLRWDQ
ncbi:MAG TPA: hypothetical protein VIY48_18840 [Candidatus Paceibacterota bacterium]